jgi:hypothetical protein
MPAEKLTVETVVRAFELPVQSVEFADGRDGWAGLRACWHEATLLANWGVQQLLLAEERLLTARLEAVREARSARERSGG